MRRPRSAAALPLVPYGTAASILYVVSGALVLGYIPLLLDGADRVTTYLVGAVVVAGIQTLLLWLVPRRSMRRELDEVAVGEVAVAPRRDAVRRGLVHGTAGGVVVVALFGAMLAALDASPGLLPGFALGGALASCLKVWDQRAWERRHGKVLCVRAGAPLLVLTRAQWLDRLVAVPADARAATTVQTG